MIMQTTDPFAEIQTVDFLDIILNGDEQADEAMYHLLHHRLNLSLKKRFETIQHQLLDDFKDIVNDFFLYLRDGNSRTNHVTYPSLHRIRNKETFVQWLLHTFRNYLSMRTAKEGPFVGTGPAPDSLPEETAASSILTDENKLSLAARLIAYAHQELPPRDSFLLLRSLLTMLDKGLTLPHEEVAKALGMSPVAYRVTVHRTKSRLAQYRTRLLKGNSLKLDTMHQQMAQRLHDDFLHLYPTLLQYYDQTIDALAPDLSVAVSRLRQSHFASTGRLLHEPATPYTAAPSKAALWNLVGRYLFSE